MDAAQVLGDRLGVLLFQLPPNLSCDLERFDKFLALLPEGLPAAFEFRHESWIDDAVTERLRDRNFALVAVDSKDTERSPLVHTASWGYLRLRRPDYDRSDLAKWANEIAALEWDRAFVFFKHENEGAGPRMATDFMAVATEKRQPRKVAATRARNRDRDRTQAKAKAKAKAKAAPKRTREAS